MARQSAAELREQANVLFYGDPGSAKTTNLATLANLGRTLHIDAESGVKPAALRKRGIDLSNLEIYPDKTAGEAMSFDGLDDLYWEIKAELEGDPDAYAGVMWDSGTETAKLLLESVVSDAVAKADRKGMERDPFFIDRGDWGVMTEQMRQLIRRYRDLPCHLGISALVRRDQDDDGKVKYGPALSPALQTDVMGYVDIVCRTFTVEVPGWGEHGEMFLGRVRAGGKFECKDRFDVLPTTMVEPTMERIIQYINGELTPDTDPLQIEGTQALEGAEAAQAEASGEDATKPSKRPPSRKGKPKRRKIAEEDVGDGDDDA